MDTSHVTVGTAMYMITDCLTYPPKKPPPERGADAALGAPAIHAAQHERAGRAATCTPGPTTARRGRSVVATEAWPSVAYEMALDGRELGGLARGGQVIERPGESLHVAHGDRPELLVGMSHESAGIGLVGPHGARGAPMQPYLDELGVAVGLRRHRLLDHCHGTVLISHRAIF